MAGGSAPAGAQWRYRHKCRTRLPIGGLAWFGPAQEIYNEELRDLLGKGPPKDKKHAVGAQ